MRHIPMSCIKSNNRIIAFTSSLQQRFDLPHDTKAFLLPVADLHCVPKHEVIKVLLSRNKNSTVSLVGFKPSMEWSVGFKDLGSLSFY